MKKHAGKGHTLYDHHPPESPEEIWILVAESCYEISQTLLTENSFARELHFSVSGYDFNAPRGFVPITPEGFVRYPDELFQTLHGDRRVETVIRTLLRDIRRIQVDAECEAFVQPLFDAGPEGGDRFALLETIRRKAGRGDAIGLGLEGVRARRLATYTPKRADEILRARELLMKVPGIRRLMGMLMPPEPNTADSPQSSSLRHG